MEIPLGAKGLRMSARLFSDRSNLFLIAQAAGAVYHFTWHTFCDWYVEAVKPQPPGKGRHEVILHDRRVFILLPDPTHFGGVLLPPLPQEPSRRGPHLLRGLQVPLLSEANRLRPLATLRGRRTSPPARNRSDSVGNGSVPPQAGRISIPNRSRASAW
jgi:hypothetical protein